MPTQLDPFAVMAAIETLRAQLKEAVSSAIVAKDELRDATNGWRRQFATLTAERDASNERADAAEALAKERARIIADDMAILLSVTTNLAEVTAAAQCVVDAWQEPERPYIGERMGILGIVLGKVKP